MFQALSFTWCAASLEASLMAGLVHIPHQRQVSLSARVIAGAVTDGCWSKSGFSPSLFHFLTHSFSLSLSPHNNPTAVLMVTLSAKSEGLDFCRTHELSTVPAVETLCPHRVSPSLLHLHLSFHLYWMFHFFLLAAPGSLCLLCPAPPLLGSSVIASCWLNSSFSFSSWFCFIIQKSQPWLGFIS